MFYIQLFRQLFVNFLRACVSSGVRWLDYRDVKILSYTKFLLFQILNIFIFSIIKVLQSQDILGFSVTFSKSLQLVL